MDTARRILVLLTPLTLLAGCSDESETLVPASMASAAEPIPPAQEGSDDFWSRASYAVGYDFGSSLRSQGVSLDTQQTAKGLTDGLSGKASGLNQQEMEAVLTRFATVMAKRTGEQFLAENKKQEGVQETKSGLQYAVLQRGDGPIPKATDRVRVHYQGSLLNGAVFDSSYASGEPAEFGVDGVIDGWTEALQKMPVGSKWRLFIPSQLAYGPQGHGPIGPHEVLVFEVELLAILP